MSKPELKSEEKKQATYLSCRENEELSAKKEINNGKTY